MGDRVDEISPVADLQHDKPDSSGGIARLRPNLIDEGMRISVGLGLKVVSQYGSEVEPGAYPMRLELACRS
jgi:hypothetical protein